MSQSTTQVSGACGSASRCPVCASESIAYAWTHGNSMISRCAKCDLEFVNPLKGQSAAVDYYRTRNKGLVEATLQDDVHPGFAYFLEHLQHVIRRYLPPDEHRSVIDIGCGPGYVLSELVKLGFDGYGLDFNPDVVRVAREHYRVSASVGRVEDIVAGKTRYNVALLVHVIEHVEDPLMLLSSIKDVLGPNGIIVIATPNRDRSSFYGSLKRGDFGEGEYPPHHVTFWNRRALTNAVKQAGYMPLECVWRPPAQGTRIERELERWCHVRDNAGTRYAGRIIRACVTRLRLQGEELLAVGRRP